MVVKVNKEKLLYMLDFFTEYVEEFVYEVLHDSKEDPHYSAVAANNLIKCYIEICNSLEEELPFQTVKEYFEFYPYTEEEYVAFEESRKSESEYYRRVQF